AEMSLRAVELLALPANRACYLLDLGCGSGLSGEILDENGHYWVGLDIAPAMLRVARDRDICGDLALLDLGGAGVPFRAGVFDGAISISTLQWLCNADHASHDVRQRLSYFFTTLYAALTRGARAVCQFYPQDDAQINLVMGAAVRAGFTGGLVID